MFDPKNPDFETLPSAPLLRKGLAVAERIRTLVRDIRTELNLLDQVTEPGIRYAFGDHTPRQQVLHHSYKQLRVEFGQARAALDARLRGYLKTANIPALESFPQSWLGFRKQSPEEAKVGTDRPEQLADKVASMLEENMSSTEPWAEATRTELRQALAELLRANPDLVAVVKTLNYLHAAWSGDIYMPYWSGDFDTDYDPAEDADKEVSEQGHS
jgi:hypothetical protein